MSLVCAIEPQLIQAVIAKIHDYRLGRGSLSQLVEDLRKFAVTYQSRDPRSTEELHAAWRHIAAIEQTPQVADFATDARQQAAVYDALDTIVRVIRRL